MSNVYARKAFVSAFLDHARGRSSTESPAEPDHHVPSGVDVAESVALRAALMSALVDLPPRQRACVVLRYFDDLSIADTAAVLGCTEGTVKSQTFRALAWSRPRPSPHSPRGHPTSRALGSRDADAEGDTYRLWSVSLTDSSDIRDEGLTVGSLAFSERSMVWTDSANGAAGRVHVRDLETGEEHAFDPRSGETCNLLTFGATDERIVMGQYCCTYDAGVRDDRVQILDTEGGQVVTFQGSGIDARSTLPTATGS